MGRWFCAFAAVCSLTPTMWKTRSRQLSWSWSRRLVRSGSASRWAPGSIRWPSGRPRVRAPAAARRQRHEQLAAERVHASHTDSRDDLGHVLHEEINRLPDRFRMSVILCDLEGRTHEQAARHLGWPVGTVKSRLTRARERLRDRLTRRGLNPGAGVIALLRPALMEDLLPGALVHSTASAAVRFGASGNLLGGTAAILAQGVLTAMSMTRWWKVASVLLVAGATVSGAELLTTGEGNHGRRRPAPKRCVRRRLPVLVPPCRSPK